MSKLDRFGILKRHPTSPFGTNTHDHKGWDFQHVGDGIVHEFQEKVKTFDYLHFIATTEPYPDVCVKGDGSVILKSIPVHSWYQMMIYDDESLSSGSTNTLMVRRGRRWTSSVEFTFYFEKKYDVLINPLKGGIQVLLPMDYHFGRSSPYNYRGYILMIENTGRMYLTGYAYLGAALRSPKPDGVDSIDFWDTAFQGLPLNVRVGIKVIQRVADDGRKVMIEVYRDMTEGLNGGTWVKMFEYLHVSGNWTDSSFQSFYDQSVSAINRIFKPVDVDFPNIFGGGITGLWLSNIHEIIISNISCRDIPNMISQPVTTSAELTASGDSGESAEGD